MPLLKIINETPTSERHISWFTRSSVSYEIELVEVIECCYPHPEAPDDAIVPVIETRSFGNFKRTTPEGAASVLLEANLKVMDNITKSDNSRGV